MSNNNKRTITVACDCGGSHIKVALLRDGIILSDAVVPNTNSETDLHKVIETVLLLLKEKNLTTDDVLGMGLSLAGIVDYDKGTLISVNGKYEWGVGFDFAQWAKLNFFSLPVVIENDARLALLGETAYGCARGFKNAVILILGTGVGTSAIIEGQLLRGVHHQAGILGGHLGCDIHGLPCNCGNKGCVEGQIGTWQLPQYLASLAGFAESSLQKYVKDNKKIAYKELFDEYRKGDEFSQKAVNNIIQLWGVAVINLVHAYDPAVVIFSGGIMNSADIIVTPIANYVKKHAWVPWGELKFVLAEDVNSSPILGLEALLKETLHVPL